MEQSSAANYEARIVPGLRRIQRRFGYLDRGALKELADELGTPLFQLQAVASFFPHFRMSEPPGVTVHVCRDMACHLAGSARVMQELRDALAKTGVPVEGVSCQGRCDRPPVVCVTMCRTKNGKAAPAAPATTEEANEEDARESYYLGRSASQIAQIVTGCMGAKESAPPPDMDIHLPQPIDKWMIDPYRGGERDYAGVKKAIAARDESLRKSVDVLRKQGWNRERAERFRLAAISRLPTESDVEKEMLDAVRDWQTETDWAAGPELGGWADAFFKELDDATLRGMGGAGIPAGQKWRDVRDAVRNARRRRQDDDRAFIVVNGDESEPSTFKDRELLLRTPHLIVEAVILAGIVTDATQGFIYIRHEYEEQIEACRAEIERAEKLGVCGTEASVLGRPFPVSVFVSPGGYICGEQSALIEAMSDRRGEPRNLPPKLETNGLDDRPTLVSNVETYGWVPYIWLKGGKTYADLGTNGWKGRRFFSVCGDVKRPGVYEVPIGLTLRDLLHGDQYCQGIKEGKKLKAFAPSGPSGGFLPPRLTAKAGLPRKHQENKTWIELAKRRGFDPTAQELDILDMELELDLFRALSPTQALGAGLAVYAEGRDMAAEAINAIHFFKNESCGKCVPCRIGSQKLAAMGANLLAGQVGVDQWQNELLPIVKDLGDVMALASICGLGRSVPMPLRTVVDFFPEDLNRHLASSGTGFQPVPGKAQ